jgi:hypothetical protein
MASISGFRFHLCLILVDGCAPSSAVHSRVLVGYHRGSLLPLCYVAYIDHVLEGMYDFL